MTKNPEENITSDRSEETPNAVEERSINKVEQQVDSTSTDVEQKDEAEDHNITNNVEEAATGDDSNTFTSIEETIKTDDQNASTDFGETSTNVKASVRPEDHSTSNEAEATAKTEEPNTSTSLEDTTGAEDQNTSNNAEEAPVSQDQETPKSIGKTARTEEDPAELDDTALQPEKPSTNEDEIKDQPVEEGKAEASGNGKLDVTDMDGGKGNNAAADAQMGTGLSGTDDIPSDVSKSEEKAESASAAEREAEPAPSQDNSSKAESGVLDNEALAVQESRYEGDFSEVSEISDRDLTVTGTAASAGAPGTTPGEGRPQDSKSPILSSTDEGRAEAGTVVPVTVPLQKSDGRSLADERGEVRGEDRNEVQGEEGGQGQWKSDEELFLKSSLMNQQAEKEALQEVIDEKVKIQMGFDDLKESYVALEENSKQWEADASNLRQTCQEQTHRIRELETEAARLKEFEHWGRDNEAKVKDLQDRLATLALEDAEKDRRIQRLQEELQDARSRLVTAEPQMAISNEGVIQQQRPVQQSKTCTIL